MIKSNIFLGLFALPFLAVGLYMLYSIGSSLVEWGDMQDWVPVQAEVVRGGYESHSGDDSTTYKAYAEYTYSFNGNGYRGVRASLSEGADNVGSFQEDLGRRLADAQGKSIEIYVDPEKPEQSIVNREMRWGMVGFKAIFVVTFGGFGGLVFVGLILGPRKQKDLTQPQYKDTPWLANKNWQGPEIGSNSKNAVYFIWFFTILWNAISAPMPFILHDEIMVKHNYPALLGLLFPLIGIGLVVAAIRRTLEWKKFGNAPVTLDPFPGSIGGNVGGTLEIHVSDPQTQFLVTLSNIEKYNRGGDDDSRERVLWQDTAVAYTESGLYGTRVVFRFDVPEGLHSSDVLKQGNNYYLWRLSVRAKVPGTDVDRDYEIPVYPTKEKSRGISARIAETSQKATLEMEDRQARSKITLRMGMNGEEMFYPMGRNLGAAITGMIVGLCFAAPGLFLILKVDAPVFGGIFIAVGALIFFCCLYMPINSLLVSKDSSGAITSTRRILGIPVKRGYAMPEDIESLTASSNFSSTSGNRQVKHYTVYAKLKNGRKITLGEDFLEQGEADAGIKLIREKLGIRQ